MTTHHPEDDDFSADVVLDACCAFRDEERQRGQADGTVEGQDLIPLDLSRPPSQAEVDIMTIDYHLHLVHEKLSQVERAGTHPPPDDDNLAAIQRHFDVLYNGLTQDNTVFLSESCWFVGTPQQRRFLMLARDRYEQIRQSIDQCLKCPHFQASQHHH